MENPNDRQVGGEHYQKAALTCTCGRTYQHWDLVQALNWDYFQGQIIKYLMRWRNKNGVQDLEKAAHFLDKYRSIQGEPPKGYARLSTSATSERDRVGEATETYINQ